MDIDWWWFPDTGVPTDCDGDGYSDSEEGVPSAGKVAEALLPDTDDDGVPDACDPDSDGDDLLDQSEADEDTDGDGTHNRLDVDSDNDGDMDGFDLDPVVADEHVFMAQGDFDGDGKVDTAIGDQTYNTYRGRVQVRYGDGTSEYWDRSDPYILEDANTYDYFGAAVGAGDIDGDGYDDLLVGVPGDDVDGLVNGGSIHVIYGAAGGLTTVGDQLVSQNTPGIQGDVEASDYFGDRVVSGDFNADGYDDLVVGSPREGIGSNSDAGAINVLYGDAGGLSTVNDMWYQGTGGVNGAAEGYDRFGDALAVGLLDNSLGADLVIGIPAEHIGAVADAGMVYMMRGGGAGLSTSNDFSFTQNDTGYADTSETNDRLGHKFWIEDRNDDGYLDLTSLVPGDACGVGTNGYHVVYGSSTGLVSGGNALECYEAYQQWN